jgi:hypothetical protein
MLGEAVDATAIHTFIGVTKRHNDARHPGFDQRLHAGSGPAMMRAGFKRHIGGAAMRRHTGHGKSPNLGMWAATDGGMSGGDKLSLG